MKKFLALFTLAGLMSIPLLALADPTAVILSFVCPDTTGAGLNSLSNFSDARIAGYGTLSVAGIPGRAPYFTYLIPAGANIPSVLNTGNYTNSATAYDPNNAIVSCSYTSSTFSPFTVSYQLTNGAGGIIDSQTANTIAIVQYVGARSR